MLCQRFVLLRCLCFGEIFYLFCNLAWHYEISIICYNMSEYLFADDVLICYVSDDYSVANTRLSTALNILETWRLDYELELNIDKTKGITFGRIRQLPQLKLRYCGENIPAVTSIKYLGIYFDNQLKWTDHINHLTNFQAGFLQFSRYTTGKHWSASTRNLSI